MLPSDLIAVRQAVLALSAHPPISECSQDVRGSLEIAVAEAMNNIVEHAYKEYPGTITLKARIDGTHLNIRIEDNGTAMRDGMVPLGEIPDFPCDPKQMPEGGYGWSLIHDLTSNLTYQRAGDRNVLNFALENGTPATA